MGNLFFHPVRRFPGASSAGGALYRAYEKPDGKNGGFLIAASVEFFVNGGKLLTSFVKQCRLKRQKIPRPQR